MKPTTISARRIHLKLTSQSGFNEAALRYRLLQLPGIQDVVFVTGAGSFMVYLYAISPVVPQSLLALANSTLAVAVAFPIQASALSPDLVGISLATTISFVAGTSPADQAVILASATTAAANYINNLAIYQPLIINQLAAQILGAPTANLGRRPAERPNCTYFHIVCLTAQTHFARIR